MCTCSELIHNCLISPQFESRQRKWLILILSPIPVPFSVVVTVVFVRIWDNIIFSTASRNRSKPKFYKLKSYPCFFKKKPLQIIF